jgi:dihydropteroate synthase
VRLGDVEHDLSTRTLVMGVLNASSHSLCERAERLVTDGADVLAIVLVGEKPEEEVGEHEEIERTAPVVEAIHDRFDTPLSVETSRSSVLRTACAAGAVIGADSAGFIDPDFLPVAAAFGATVIATHRGPAPGVADVRAFLAARVACALDAGVTPDRIVVDAGLGLGKMHAQSVELLRRSAELGGLGAPLLLAPDNGFLGEGDPAIHAASALGVSLGCRILRVHDVKGARRVADVLAAILEARVPVRG